MRNGIELDSRLTVLPPSFGRGTYLPGDLTTIAPYGNGVYGYNSKNVHPFTLAPEMEAEGGLIFFDNKVAQPDLFSMLRVLGIRANQKDYAIFYDDADQPKEQGYIQQIRIVSKFALCHMFAAINTAEYTKFKPQELSLEEAMWDFIQRSNKKYGTGFGAPLLAGKFGGDGNYAQEELSYGFMVENSYYGIYRIWSRAWLVTK